MADPTRPVPAAGVLVCLGLLLALILPSPLRAAGMPAKGAFLVAADSLVDPRFRQAVVLLLEHGPDGSVGLIVNKPLTVPVGGAIANLPPGIDGEAPLFFGGPVSPAVVWILFAAANPPPTAVEIVPGVHADNAIRVLNGDLPVEGLKNIRFYTGYAGWAPGQLEREMERGDWTVERGRPADVFDSEPESLWEYLSGKRGGVLI